MMSLGFADLDINDPNITYFEVELAQVYLRNGMEVINYTVIPTEKCTRAHGDFRPYLTDFYDKLRMDQALCPALGQ